MVWMRATVEAILKSENLEEFKTVGYGRMHAPLEFADALTTFIAEKRPRLARTHLRYNYLPKEITKVKVIHVMRNPRDIAVSYFHFAQKNTLYNFTGTWDTFFDLFMEGKIAWGGWYEYMMDWLIHKEEPNILFVKYEDYLQNPEDMIQKIATFIGKPIDKVTAARVAEVVSFKSMKNNPKLSVIHETMKGDWLRKGVVGDWVNYFTEAQLERVQKMYKKFNDNTGIELRFQ